MVIYAEVIVIPTTPSFSSLLAFDAAARHGTFTRAASELNVSQPAVSRRVAALEADIGVALFDRSSKPMQLTAEGVTLFDVLRSGLSRLETTVEDLRESARHRKFTIAAAPGFLSYWLLPRLSALNAAFPELDLSLMTGDYGASPTSCDVQIRFGGGNWEGVISEKFLGEEVFPICSPVYLDGRDPHLTDQTIQSSRLLHLSDSFERWYDWRSWMATAGIFPDKPPTTIDFDSYATVINAVFAGQGIALCWSGLLEPYLQSGALIRVSDHCLTSHRGYFATYDQRLPKNSTAARVAQWFCDSNIDQE